MLSEEDTGLIKLHRIENVHGATRIMDEFTRSGAFCKSESTAAGSVTSTVWKND